MTNMILWKWDSMMLWNMSIYSIIFRMDGVHHGSTMAAPEHCRGWSLALLVVTSPSGQKSGQQQSTHKCGPALPVPLTLAEPQPDDEPTLLLASEHGWSPWGLLQIHWTVADQSRGPVIVASTSQLSLPECLWSPLSPHCHFQHFLCSTVIFHAEMLRVKALLCSFSIPMSCPPY